VRAGGRGRCPQQPGRQCQLAPASPAGRALARTAHLLPVKPPSTPPILPLCPGLLLLQTIREEEASFSRTLVKGIERFKKAAAASQDGRISGQEAFVLWDTFGFPSDLTQLMAEEAKLEVDMQGGSGAAVWRAGAGA
jgi:hypothetical protein